MSNQQPAITSILNRAVADQFRIKSGDTLLKDHLTKAAQNATYTFSVIQNQIIDVVSNHIRNKIIRKVQAAKWFSIIADEVTDVSNEEIISFYVRYWDSESCIIREDLLGFFECHSGIRGRNIAEKITTTLRSFGLDLFYLRGQAYDVAGTMTGSVNGTAAIISHDYPQALYLHCASHCLNLAAVKSLEVAFFLHGKTIDIINPVKENDVLVTTILNIIK
ncbi:PREDICTED: 52 kDa repressor of the inhibitor of the protein kinase-like, partial [Amphimedon queenslandica]|uniref:DUF4371 domain-containing protein n=1 Tax=Amphimedon queenslandica TaxID=400682 RepID=A0AAN0IRZ1_AMPQE